MVLLCPQPESDLSPSDQKHRRVDDNQIVVLVCILLYFMPMDVRKLFPEFT